MGLDVETLAAQSANYAALDLRGVVLEGWTLSHVVRGAVRTRAGQAQATAREGWVMVHPPRVPFDEHADGPGTHEFATFAFRSARPLDPLARLPLALAFPLDDRAVWSRRFGALLEARRGSGPEAEIREAAALLGLVEATVAAWRAAGRPARPEEAGGPLARFAGLLAFMEANLDRPLTRAEMADRACLHPGSLDRAFRAALGVPPTVALRDMRLDRAERLLETTDLPLAEIAARCGVGDAPYLVRLFRAHRGTTPGAHRERARRTTEGYVRTTPEPAERGKVEA